jgi:hypothetical protein
LRSHSVLLATGIMSDRENGKGVFVRVRPLLVLAISIALASLLSIGKAAQLAQTIVLHVGDRGRLVLELGNLAVNSKGATQPLSLKNDGSEVVANVEIKCGFFAGSTLLGLGSASARDLKPGSSTRADIIVAEVAAADSVRCQVSSD